MMKQDRYCGEWCDPPTIITITIITCLILTFLH